jgi:hypothetical protein
MAPVSAPAVTNEVASTTAPDRRAQVRRPVALRPLPAATDDEILGLDPATVSNDDAARAGLKAAPTTDDASDASETADSNSAVDATAPEPIRAALEANPDLRRAWDDAQAYRETFATPEEARAATAQLADLDRMDALFFSRRPEDHAELARTVAAFDPAAFASLAQAMNAFAGARHAAPGTNARQDQNNSAPPRAVEASVGAAFKPARTAENPTLAAPSETAQPSPSSNENRRQDASATITQSQSDFFHATNAAAVQSVLDAIEIQVERLLPENISKSARNRVVGEIYRELDTTLRSNRQLAQQMREAFRSGGLDAEHQRAVVSLVSGRARQALPGVAKRVLNEWTSTVVAAHNDRRARQQAAERRVDIGGSGGAGSDGPRSMTPREVDYRRMSDADILNL